MAINTPGARAAIQATKHIPIVMATVGDPVAVGVGFGLWHTQNRVFALWRDHPEARDTLRPLVDALGFALAGQPTP